MTTQRAGYNSTQVIMMLSDYINFLNFYECINFGASQNTRLATRLSLGREHSPKFNEIYESKL
jgi:hypothetical protein